MNIFFILIGFWLGFSVSFIGHGILTWEFWFVVAPTITFIFLKDVELEAK